MSALLKLATVLEEPDRRPQVRLLDGAESLEAGHAGTLIERGRRAGPGDLVALDMSAQPPEIAHIYPARLAGAAAGPEARQEAEADFASIAARLAPASGRGAAKGGDYMSWTGLAAQIWDPSGGGEPQQDYAYLKKAIQAGSGPALDIGCGTGRLLLRYLSEGLDVDGVDPSKDMLDLCREKGRAAGLSPQLYRQSMHELDLPRRYRTVFIPCGTFCLLVRREHAFQALARIYDHLEPGGELVFNLFWEYGPGGWFWNRPDGKWWAMFHHPHPEGGIVFQHMKTLQVDRANQLLSAERRYRLVRDGQVVREEIFASHERLYGKFEIEMMLAQAGFQDIRIYDGWRETPRPFDGDPEVMVLHARKPDHKG